MKAKSMFQFTAVMVLAVLAGMLGVQGTWALWNAQVPSGAGTVQAANFEVLLNGTPMVTGGTSATVALPNPAARIAPKKPVYAEVTIRNTTNAGSAFTIRATPGTPVISNTSNALAQGLRVATAAAPATGCSTAQYTGTAPTLTIAKGASATLCVRIGVADDAPETLRNTNATVTIPVTVTQVVKGS